MIKPVTVLSAPLSRSKVVQATDSQQRSGRLTAVFPTILQCTAKEEAYIERMILKDREQNIG